VTGTRRLQLDGLIPAIASDTAVRTFSINTGLVGFDDHSRSTPPGHVG
jgi:hypothetical protein